MLVVVPSLAPLVSLVVSTTRALEVAKMFEDAGIRDVSIKLYHGDRHEILNELDRETVYEDLLNWIQARMK